MATRSIHQFSEKVVLITDGTEPVGRAIAMQLALNGAYVLVGVPNGVDDGGLISEMGSLGTLAGGIDFDPAKEDGFNELVEGVKNRFGRLDILVNCLKNFTDSDSIEFEGVLPARRSIAAAAGLMSERPGPVIVNVIFEGHAWSASEEELVSVSSSELPAHFRINAVKWDGELEKYGSVSPDDFARVIFFLVSSEAKAINGQSIRLGYRGKVVI
jgi:NAD(P)-dependent dehydrogenase (short-subunit alcohol dehydrogenase family)